MSGRDAPIVVSPGKVSLDDLAQVLAGAAVVLDPSFWPRVEAASAIVAEAASAQIPAYGINTGFGKLASKRIPPDQTALLQTNLIVSHCCGVGPPTPEAIVRLMVALKIISLGRGASGVRREVIEQLAQLLLVELAVLLGQVTTRVEQRERHDMPTNLDVTDLLDLKNPAAGDPRPGAYGVEPKVRSRHTSHPLLPCQTSSRGGREPDS